MILETTRQVDVRIDSLDDLPKLKPLMEGGVLKVNKSAIARDLNCDRRTVGKHIDGFKKKKTRSKPSKIDAYYDTVYDLLYGDTSQRFFYKRVLWQYLKDNKGLDCPQSSFRRWISKHDELQSYFDGVTNRTVNGNRVSSSSKHNHVLHYETMPGEEAQIDWKESMDFLLKDGEIITINIFAFVLSYSRYKVWYLSINKTRDILFHFLDSAFKTIGGVPLKIKTDNMKTVMDKARTEHSKGIVNSEFAQFAKDYGFEVKPCRVSEPEVKSKVESPMRLLDELYAYNGLLDIAELERKLKDINDRENSKYHDSTGKIPMLHLEKEKDSLLPLPKDNIRNHYRIKTITVKVNSQSNITYLHKFYSVPKEYIGKSLDLQIYDEYLHLYFNTKLVTIHKISNDQKWNYKEEHYKELVGMSITNDKDAIDKIAKENLKRIGDIYK